MSNLAVTYFAVGRFAEALALHEETYRLRKAKLGVEHPDTLYSMSNLAGSLAHAGRHQEALDLRLETLRLRKAKLGPDHPQTLASMHRLAASYAALNRYDEALSLNRDTLKLRQAKLGAHHPDTLLSMAQLGECLVATKQLDQALPLFAEAVSQILQKKLVNTNAAWIITQAVDAGQAAEQWRLAESWQRQWTALVKEKLGTSSLDHGQALLDLGTLLLKQKKLGDAEPILLEAQANLQLHASAASRQAMVLDRLVELYAALGNPKEAARWRTERERLVQPSVPVTAPR